MPLLPAGVRERPLGDGRVELATLAPPRGRCEGTRWQVTYGAWTVELSARCFRGAASLPKKEGRPVKTEAALVMPICADCGIAYLDGESHVCPPKEESRAVRAVVGAIVGGFTRQFDLISWSRRRDSNT